MKPEKSIQGMEQLLYLRNSSSNSAPGGHILDRTGAHQIMRQLAHTHLQPKPDVQPKPDLQPQPQPQPQPELQPKPKPKPKRKPKPSSSDSDSDSYSGPCFRPSSNDYWNVDLVCKELDPALWQDLAVVALKYLHEKQGVELELNGEIIVSPLHYGGGVGFHLDFQANDSTGSPKKIFAEVFRFKKNGECRVLFCDIMDPNDPDLLKGCRFCSPWVLHPKGMKFFKCPSDWSDASV